jgi:RNA polymerase sigma factor (sigma-70 family)
VFDFGDAGLDHVSWGELSALGGHEQVMAETDRQLWLEVGEGSTEAFVALYERHLRVVYNYCFRRTGDWALAEDLSSAVFLETWRRRGEIHVADGSLVPWLLGVATNVIRNSRRTTRRYRSAVARLPSWHSDPDFADEIDERLDAESKMREILARVSRLPRKDQEVLALCAWMGLSYEDAARALDIPVGTVRSRLSRARTKLREPLGEVGHEQNAEVVERVPSSDAEGDDRGA